MKKINKVKKSKNEKLMERNVFAVYSLAFELLKSDDTKNWIEYIAEENGLLNNGCFKNPIKKHIILYVAMLYTHVIITKNNFKLTEIPHINNCTIEEFADLILKVGAGIIEEMKPLQDISVNFNDYLEDDEEQTF
ncbi:hypothetical protein M3610_09175 [Neobacillus sp. MER 74]|uniref:hypothetical protein n=1 Tax=Neobacillus sp. MER 74 TaxID=2939566 RepID=UPI002042395F|nr:hypothetical protein [Neobacillus sp. MER 74]MCM3115458.1 hypothetical protein [Neobacillus sp. MER 74]